MASSVIVALRIKAPPARVFDVFTREIATWWKPNGLFQFTPRSPGVLAFEPCLNGRFTETLADGKVFDIGRITAWAPGEHLAFTWRQATFGPDQITRVEVRFEPVLDSEGGEETRVTVEHRGWDSVPADHVAKHRFPEPIFLKRHAEWWRALLRSLDEAI